MAVLRDIVAKLTLDLDDKSFKSADASIDGTTAAMGKLGTAAVAATAAMGVGLGIAIKAAADANETLNLMGLTFQDNTDDVLAWGAAFSKAAGRSEFELREMATQLGSVLTPLLDNNIDQATEFAKSLSERAVDFGSARNVGDLEAANAFISGLTGETEPLKRFGIVMTDASLNAFALSQGIGKTTKQMNDAEKTQLRYNFLMERTAIFEGDAANTSESFANATKALSASLTDLGTRIGGKFLPTAEKIIRVVRDVVQVLGTWVENSHLIEAALIVLGGIASAVALRIAASWILANIPLILMAIGVAALILILDDFLTFLAGGDSVIGRFIDSIFGPGSAAAALETLQAGFEDTKTIASETLDAIGMFMANLSIAFVDDMNAMGKAFDDFAADWKAGAKIISDWADRLGNAASFLNIGGGVPGLPGQVGGGVPQLAGASSPAAVAAGAGAGNGGDTTINQSVSVQVPPGTPETVADRTAAASQSAVDASNRRTMRALTQRGE